MEPTTREAGCQTPSSFYCSYIKDGTPMPVIQESFPPTIHHSVPQTVVPQTVVPQTVVLQTAPQTKPLQTAGPRVRVPLPREAAEGRPIEPMPSLKDTDYFVTPLLVYRPKGKNEERLVYRVTSALETPEGNVISTRHQKSFSIAKWGVKNAKKMADEAFEYCKQHLKLPQNIVLPASALVVYPKARKPRSDIGIKRNPYKKRQPKNVVPDDSEFLDQDLGLVAVHRRSSDDEISPCDASDDVFLAMLKASEDTVDNTPEYIEEPGPVYLDLAPPSPNQFIQLTDSENASESFTTATPTAGIKIEIIPGAGFVEVATSPTSIHTPESIPKNKHSLTDPSANSSDEPTDDSDEGSSSLYDHRLGVIYSEA